MYFQMSTVGVQLLVIISTTIQVLATDEQLVVLNFDEKVAGAAEDLFLTCKPSYSNITITDIKWKNPKNEVIKTASGNVRIYVEHSVEEKTLSLIFKNIEYEDKGNYTCEMTVDEDIYSKNFTLHVIKPIKFADTPLTQYMDEGSSGYIRCKVEGDPLPTIQWRGRQQDWISDLRYLQKEEGFLINNVSRRDAGTYICAAIQQNTRITNFIERKIHLVVRYKPEWKKPIVDKVSSYTTWTSNLTCEADGKPAPKFLWFRNKTLVTTEPGGNYKILATEGKSILQIQMIDETDFGVYECEATNDMGTIKREILLKKGAGVSMPNVTVKESQHDSIELGITISKTDFKISKFVIQYKIDNEVWDDARKEEFEYGKPYILRNLQHNTSYVIRVAARTSAGLGEFTHDISQMTQQLKDTSDDGNNATVLNPHSIGILCLIYACSLTLNLVQV